MASTGVVLSTTQEADAGNSEEGITIQMTDGTAKKSSIVSYFRSAEASPP